MPPGEGSGSRLSLSVNVGETWKTVDVARLPASDDDVGVDGSLYFPPTAVGLLWLLLLWLTYQPMAQAAAIH